jgi:hypothetical protein
MELIIFLGGFVVGSISTIAIAVCIAGGDDY